MLTASRLLVAVAARSLADAGEEVTLTQYRSLVVLASRGPQRVAALAEARGGHPVDGVAVSASASCARGSCGAGPTATTGATCGSR